LSKGKAAIEHQDRSGNNERFHNSDSRLNRSSGGKKTMVNYRLKLLLLCPIHAAHSEFSFRHKHCFAGEVPKPAHITVIKRRLITRVEAITKGCRQLFP
jgi:hypothetical protein